MKVLKVGCNCSVVATLLQLYIVNMIFGCIRCSLQRCSNFAATLHGGCNNWLQLQRCSNVSAISNFQLNFWSHTVQFATLQQRCMEVAIIGCNCNVVATFLQLQIFNSIFGCIRCSLQRCSNVAATLQ